MGYRKGWGTRQEDAGDGESQDLSLKVESRDRKVWVSHNSQEKGENECEGWRLRRLRVFVLC